MRGSGVYFAYGVIDEVHCVSEWGHDFRFLYLHLGRNLYSYARPYPTGQEKLDHITLIGLTATASFDVLADVERELSGDGSFPLDAQSTIRYENTNRLELQYRVIKMRLPVKHDNKWPIYSAKNGLTPRIISETFSSALRALSKPEAIKRIKKRFIERENIDSESAYALEIGAADIAVDIDQSWYRDPACGAAAIVFCPHRKGSLGVYDNDSYSGIATRIKEELHIERVSCYQGGDTPEEQDEFIGGKTNIMVVTP